MARVTIEDCLERGYNKFMLVHLAAKRVIQLRKGKEPLISASNKEIVTALREIAASKIGMRTINDVPEANSEIEYSASAGTELETVSEKESGMESEASTSDSYGKDAEISENEVNPQPVENEDTTDTM
jgi:DNA-directed RNA polymerase subunit omega